MERSEKIMLLKNLHAGKVNLKQFAATYERMNLELLTTEELLLLEQLLTVAEERSKRILYTEPEAGCIEYYRLLSLKRTTPEPADGDQEKVKEWYQILNLKK